MRVRDVLRTPHRVCRRLAGALLGSCHNGLSGCRRTHPLRILFQTFVKVKMKANHLYHILF
jgi:hypothetical protein